MPSHEKQVEKTEFACFDYTVCVAEAITVRYDAPNRASKEPFQTFIDNLEVVSATFKRVDKEKVDGFNYKLSGYSKLTDNQKALVNALERHLLANYNLFKEVK